MKPRPHHFRSTVAAAWLIFATVFAPGCSTVPETGRSQLNLISPAEEMRLGYTAFAEMKKELKISSDAKINKTVETVGRRIAAVARLPGAEWEFVVFESEEANAFCLPGGKVGIYTGILPITKDEAGLAAVIGHEVAHAVARHGAERMSEALLIGVGGSLVDAGLADGDPKTRALSMMAYGLGSSLGRALPHSRMQESEADRIGLLYMARAGYDPAAAIALWERFAAVHEKKGSGGPWFLRTHPVDEVRIQQLKAWLPEARREYRR